MASEVEKSELKGQIINAIDEHFMKNEQQSLCSSQLAAMVSVPHEKVVGVLKSLASKSYITLVDGATETFLSVTPEAIEYIADGTPEWLLLEFLKKHHTVPMHTLKESCGNSAGTLGLMAAIKLEWVQVKDQQVHLLSKGSTTDDVVRKALVQISELQKKNLNTKSEISAKIDNKLFTMLTTRKLIVSKQLKQFEIRRGEKSSEEAFKPAALDLTKDMLINDQWKNLEFKPYNYNAAGKRLEKGSVHLLSDMAARFKKVLNFMGFLEMPTRSWVESSFWNFDSLFQPQNHPARDAHDTFFLKNPKYCDSEIIPEEYKQKVKDVHETGSGFSRGWEYEWSEEESRKNVLRTHTTACTSKLLVRIAQRIKLDKSLEEGKYFSIDRVFRHEATDSTHLAEFHQIEGVIIGRSLSLAHLMGYMQAFYSSLGFSDLRFKPTYNPYTEPSLEIYGYQQHQDRWLEVGNSGIFRPEMLEPMGFPSYISVLGFGLSLERPTMIESELKDIRQLLGHRSVIY